MLKGIDISSWQTARQVYQNADQAQACMIKATQGNYYVNGLMAPQTAAALGCGMQIGFYHYVTGAPDEASYFLSRVKAMHLKTRPLLALDFEESNNNMFNDTSYCEQLADAIYQQWGAYPVVYASFAHLDKVASALKKCGLWGAGYPLYTDSWAVPTFLSQYADAVQSAGATLTGWQFTGKGIDRSAWYLDRDTWQRIADGPNSIQKTDTEPIKKTTDTPPATSTLQLSSWTDELGDTWYHQDGKFTVGVSALNLRWGATLESKIITQLHAGDMVIYDAWSHHGGYTWIRQPRGGGEYGYCVCRENGTPWGTFS